MSQQLSTTRDQEQPNTMRDSQVIACPACATQITFCRSDAPQIDSCGFESYRLECENCGAQLTGIVDPRDDALLLSS